MLPTFDIKVIKSAVGDLKAFENRQLPSTFVNYSMGEKIDVPIIGPLILRKNERVQLNDENLPFLVKQIIIEVNGAFTKTGLEHLLGRKLINTTVSLDKTLAYIDYFYLSDPDSVKGFVRALDRPKSNHFVMEIKVDSKFYGKPSKYIVAIQKILD